MQGTNSGRKSIEEKGLRKISVCSPLFFFEGWRGSFERLRKKIHE
jgi:hypothetical protein